MALWVKRHLQLEVAADQFYAKLHFKCTKDTVEHTTLTHHVDFARSFAADANVALDLAGITTGKVLFVQCDRQLNVMLDGAEVVPVIPPTTTSPAILYLETEFTSISIVNPDSNNNVNAIIAISGV